MLLDLLPPCLIFFAVVDDLSLIPALFCFSTEEGRGASFSFSFYAYCFLAATLFGT